jgi:hypothetical protein
MALRGSTGRRRAVHGHLSLLSLKYISNTFEQRHAALFVETGAEARRLGCFPKLSEGLQDRYDVSRQRQRP